MRPQNQQRQRRTQMHYNDEMTVEVQLVWARKSKSLYLFSRSVLVSIPSNRLCSRLHRKFKGIKLSLELISLTHFRTSTRKEAMKKNKIGQLCSKLGIHNPFVTKENLEKRCIQYQYTMNKTWTNFNRLGLWLSFSVRLEISFL